MKIGAGGGTRTPTGKSPTDFLTHFGFRRPVLTGQVCGLDYPFTVASFEALGAARLVSTPSSQRERLGSGSARSDASSA